MSNGSDVWFASILNLETTSHEPDTWSVRVQVEGNWRTLANCPLGSCLLDLSKDLDLQDSPDWTKWGGEMGCPPESPLDRADCG